MENINCNIVNAHPRDRHISFEEVEHVYTHDHLGRFSSWTETISSFFPPFDADAAAESVAAKQGVAKEDVLSRWTHETDLGTQLHANIEHFLNGDAYTEDDVFSMFRVFYQEHRVVPYRTEWTIFDEDARIAGTIDALDFHICPIMLDWKRSKNLFFRDRLITDGYKGAKGLGPLSHLPDCSYYHYAMQQSGYRYILETRYGISLQDCFLVVMHPTLSKYRIVRMPYLKKEVQEVVALRKALFSKSN